MRQALCLLSLVASACGAGDPGPDDFSDLAYLGEKSDAFSYRMRVVGWLGYNQGLGVQYANPPRYRAIRFAGNEGDTVKVTIASADGAPIAWVLDSRFRTLGPAFHEESPAITLPASTTTTHYIVLREASLQPASFAVDLAGTPKTCTQNGLCAAGYHWDQASCGCLRDQDLCGGCKSGEYCSYCWGHWACVPNGAIC